MAQTTSGDRARAPAAQLLRDALSELANNSGGGGRPTATSLCKLAGVSRNTLYADHKDILRELYKLQRRRHRAPSPAHQLTQRLRDENEALKMQVKRLAALIDHYFSAWSESSTLLQRRERELADFRKGTKSGPVSIQK
jgi:hypothetical protein